MRRMCRIGLVIALALLAGCAAARRDYTAARRDCTAARACRSGGFLYKLRNGALRRRAILRRCGVRR